MLLVVLLQSSIVLLLHCIEERTKTRLACRRILIDEHDALVPCDRHITVVGVRLWASKAVEGYRFVRCRPRALFDDDVNIGTLPSSFTSKCRNESERKILEEHCSRGILELLLVQINDEDDQ
jgi:hypothetical protein